jgi:hypothetical protein
VAVAAALGVLGACATKGSEPLFDGTGGATSSSTATTESASSGGGAPTCDETPSGSCEACLDASCCGPKLACDAGTPCAAFADCAEAANCFDDADFDGCATAACPDTATKTAVEAFQALAACAHASCSDDC